MDCVVLIASVYVQGEYDGFGGVEIHVDSNTGYGNDDKHVVHAYLEQARNVWQRWSIDEDSLLATEIYCNGKAGEGHHPARSLEAFLLKKDDPFQGQDRFCAPEGIRVQESLHVWHLASLPKAMPSNNNRNLCERSMNSMNVPKKRNHKSRRKTKKSAMPSNKVVEVPEEW